jgi:DNA-binding CsgD family transcriptional regulator
MAGGRSVKTSDVKALLQLASALHAAPDPISRKREMLVGLCRLTGAFCGAVLVSHADPTPRDKRIVSQVIYDPSATALREADTPIHPTASGCDLVSPGPDHVVPGQTGAYLASSRKLGETGGAATVHLFRSPGQRGNFTARHQLLVDLFHKNSCWVYEPDLVLLSPNARSLSPGERQTLEYLLAGLSEKQIATRMRLSRNTVHHYVKSLHKHFSVSSRSELLARWVGK